MLSYFRQVRCDGYTLSIDNMVIDYYLHPLAMDGLSRMLRNLDYDASCTPTHWLSSKVGSFRDQFTVAFDDGSSFWLGVGLQQGSFSRNRVRLEFNPNKIAHFSVFRSILALLNGNSSPRLTNVRRFDLAVDFPVLRENAFLCKDLRKKTTIDDGGGNKTEYLGVGQNHGRIKLYNKQAESKLSYPLTRLELTLDPEVPYEEIRFPKMYFIRDLQMAFDECKLDATARFILGALLQGYGDPSQLGRYMREKIEKVLSQYVTFFTLPKGEYGEMLSQVRSFLRYPVEPLDHGPSDFDSHLPEGAALPEISLNDFEEAEDPDAPF